MEAPDGPGNRMTPHSSLFDWRRRSSTPDVRLRWFLVACGLAAIAIAAAAQAVLPARGNTAVALFDTVGLPALIVALLIVNRRNDVRLLVLTCGLIYVEAILLASLYAIGMAFAILLPMIGIGLLQGRIGRWAKVIAYTGAAVVASLSVLLVELHVPTNDLGEDQPQLAVVAFALVAAFALGLTWRTGERLTEALDAARDELEARIEAERAQSEAADALETLVRLSPVATMALDSERRITVWNPAAERLFGWTRDEVLGRHVVELGAQTGHTRDVVLEWVEGAVNGATGTVEGTTKSGATVTFELHAARRLDAEGRLRELVVQAIDVTARAALEAQLRQAQKMEAVGHLAGGVAHDINNTLAAVGGFAQLIHAESTDPEVRADADEIAQAVERGSELTTRLLAFARQSVLQPRTFEVGRYLESLLPVLRRLVGADVDIEFRNGAGTAAVHVDAGQFEQALLNLVVNARDAMPAGGHLLIETSRAARDQDTGVEATSVPTALGGNGTTASEPAAMDAADSAQGAMAAGDQLAATGGISVAVSDTGTGIAPEILEQVFEPFFTTKEHGRGTGLGLAMVYGFVTQSGGRVSIQSSVGEGTTVTIWLPDAAPSPSSPAAQPDHQATTPSDRRGPQPGGGSETILLIEDEELVAMVAAKTLARLGYRVLQAADGTEAIETARSEGGPIGLILSDVIMPGMSGPEAVEAVLEIHPEAAVLYASGYTADVITERGVLPPGVELIQKPYRADELASRVRALIDTGGGENGRRRPPDGAGTRAENADPE